MDLREQAEELGIKVDGRWSDTRLQEEIDAALSGPAEEKAPEPQKPKRIVKNVTGNRWIVCGNIVEPGAIYKLTDNDMKNERGMKRVHRGVEIGVLQWQ